MHLANLKQMNASYRLALAATVLALPLARASAIAPDAFSKASTPRVIIGPLTYTPGYSFSTFAGAGGQEGLVNGTGTAARFNGPGGIGLDASGNLYVADGGNWVIRKITPAGVVTTFANLYTYEGASDVKVDANGNVFATAFLMNVVLKISPDGTVSVFAGTVGVTGSADGTGAAAEFNGPGGLAIANDGTLYVTDGGNNTVRKITPDGIVTTIAGTAGTQGSADGTGAAASFYEPSGLALDSAGNLFVADSGNNTIRKITAAGAVTTFAGSPRVEQIAQDGTGAAASFAHPGFLAFDASGNLLVTDGASQLIRRITPAAVVSTAAGTAGEPGGNDGSGSAAAFDGPSGIVIDASGNIYVSDAVGNTIRKGNYTPPPAPVTISVNTPLPSTAVENGSASILLTTTTTGNPTSFQWYLNGAAIAGATSYQLLVSPTAASQGDYSVSASNATSSASTGAGTLTVSTDAWIINLSARAYSQSGSGGANQLIAGFVTTGPDSKSILIRGDGPALGAFNVTGYLTDPQLTLVAGSTTVASTDSWSSNLSTVFASVGAFALAPGSHDTALLETLAPGAYTAQVISQTSNNGVALAEIYDADDLAPTDRLVNISARAFVGTGSDILIGGFVISGTTPQTVIIRGDGPALAGFGLSGALKDATLTLSNGNGTVATNHGWDNVPSAGSAATGGIVIQPLTAALSAKVGGFALTVGSNDSAIVATLPPGAYTAQVTGTNGATGIALVEIYELR